MPLPIAEADVAPDGCAARVTQSGWRGELAQFDSVGVAAPSGAVVEAQPAINDSAAQQTKIRLDMVTP
jgi:hypothetical protein